jgi:hypothetical protein
MASRLLFRNLLRRALATTQLFAIHNCGDGVHQFSALRFFGDDFELKVAAPLRSPLVQLGLEIFSGMDFIVSSVSLQQAHDGFARLFVPVVQINSADEGLHRIAYNGVADVLPAHFSLNKRWNAHPFSQ